MNWNGCNDNEHEYTLGEPLTPAHTPRPVASQALDWPIPEADTRPQTTHGFSGVSGIYPADVTGGKIPTRKPSAKRFGVHQARFCPEDLKTQLASHTHHLSPNPSILLPPVESSRLLSSSPSPNLLQRTHADTPVSIDADGGDREAIQTPPLTASAQRRPGKLVGKGSVSAMADGRRMSNGRNALMGPPETPSRIVQASPQVFSSLQFSPDLFQPQLMSGPATAPIFPQQRLFWDSSTSAGDDFSTPRQYQDPFAGSHNELTSPFPASPGVLHPFPASDTHQMQELPSQGKAQPPNVARPTSFDATAFPAPFTTSPRIPPSSGDDPSLFLSSPARRFGGPEPSSTFYSRPTVAEKPAYYHQIEESKREKEYERARKAKARRSSGIIYAGVDTKRSVSPAMSNRPGLKRSFTHSGVETRRPHSYHQGQASFADLASISSGRSGIVSSHEGRSSPLKASSAYQITSELPAANNRTSLAFTIDEDGRAKVMRLPDSNGDVMDLDEESSASEAESMDDSDFQMLQSQHDSYAFLEQEESPAVAHLRKQWNHSKNSSCSSTLGSHNSNRQSSHASSNTSGSKPKPNKSNNLYAQDPQNRYSQPMQGASTINHPDQEQSAAESARKGNAQEALRAILNDRVPSKTAQDLSRRSASFTHFHSSPPVQRPNSTYALHDTSPTTITDPDITTPSTDRESFISNGSTRCICSSSSPGGQFMIQCESCSKWLHTSCVGVDSRAIPAVYICVFCAQTPMRHGRIREPRGPQAPPSPLAHKSNSNSNSNSFRYR